MSIYTDWFDISEEVVNGHDYKAVNLVDNDLEPVVKEIANVVPNHYIDPESIAHTLEQLGKPAAAKKLRTKIPNTKTMRSGELGEILSMEYIDDQTQYIVPIKKLRWKDHQEMAMKGEDVIGIRLDENSQKPHFLKTEAKSSAKLATRVLQDARLALDANDGRPTPHALAFVAERLREQGDTGRADAIDRAQFSDGIAKHQIEHLLFTFTGSSPNNLQKKNLRTYNGDIKQHAVGLRIKEHQEFIACVFEEVESGFDDQGP